MWLTRTLRSQAVEGGALAPSESGGKPSGPDSGPSAVESYLVRLWPAGLVRPRVRVDGVDPARSKAEPRGLQWGGLRRSTFLAHVPDFHPKLETHATSTPRAHARKTREMISVRAFTELRARSNAGEEVSFDAFAGKVVLVVNVARL